MTDNIFHIETYHNNRWTVEESNLSLKKAIETVDMCDNLFGSKPRVVANQETYQKVYYGQHTYQFINGFEIEIYNQKHDMWMVHSGKYTINEAMSELEKHDNNNDIDRYRIVKNKKIICYGRHITTSPFDFSIQQLINSDWDTLYDDLCVDDAYAKLKILDKENEAHYRIFVTKNGNTVRYGKLGNPLGDDPMVHKITDIRQFSDNTMKLEDLEEIRKLAYKLKQYQDFIDNTYEQSLTIKYSNTVLFHIDSDALKVVVPQEIDKIKTKLRMLGVNV